METEAEALKMNFAHLERFQTLGPQANSELPVESQESCTQPDQPGTALLFMTSNVDLWGGSELEDPGSRSKYFQPQTTLGQRFFQHPSCSKVS